MSNNYKSRVSFVKKKKRKIYIHNHSKTSDSKYYEMKYTRSRLVLYMHCFIILSQTQLGTNTREETNSLAPLFTNSKDSRRTACTEHSSHTFLASGRCIPCETHAYTAARGPEFARAREKNQATQYNPLLKPIIIVIATAPPTIFLSLSYLIARLEALEAYGALQVLCGLGYQVILVLATEAPLIMRKDIAGNPIDDVGRGSSAPTASRPTARPATS